MSRTLRTCMLQPRAITGFLGSVQSKLVRHDQRQLPHAIKIILSLCSFYPSTLPWPFRGRSLSSSRSCPRAASAQHYGMPATPSTTRQSPRTLAALASASAPSHDSALIRTGMRLRDWIGQKRTKRNLGQSTGRAAGALEDRIVEARIEVTGVQVADPAIQVCIESIC